VAGCANGFEQPGIEGIVGSQRLVSGRQALGNDVRIGFLLGQLQAQAYRFAQTLPKF
jgi:hypothetical protein